MRPENCSHAGAQTRPWVLGGGGGRLEKQGLVQEPILCLLLAACLVAVLFSAQRW